jgi:hypothetical protein
MHTSSSGSPLGAGVCSVPFMIGAELDDPWGGIPRWRLMLSTSSCSAQYCPCSLVNAWQAQQQKGVSSVPSSADKARRGLALPRLTLHNHLPGSLLSHLAQVIVLAPARPRWLRAFEARGHLRQQTACEERTLLRAA